MTETTNQPEIPIVDRRNARRHRSLLGAQIILRNGNCVVGGQILNVSDAGALVKPADLVSCPEKFALKTRFESPRECEVMWRKGEMLGVRYV
jgi:hypothetical protein